MKSGKDYQFHGKPDISVDYEFWASAAVWTVEDFSYLAVGIDPIKLGRVSPEVTLELYGSKRREIREKMQVLLRGRKQTREMSPSEFLSFARDAKVELPDELISRVQSRASSSTKKNTSGQQNRISRVEHNNLLKMFLAVAVYQYSYDPTKKRQKSVNQILDDAAELGISLDDETVRSRLREALEVLNGIEQAGVSEFVKGQN